MGSRDRQGARPKQSRKAAEERTFPADRMPFGSVQTRANHFDAVKNGLYVSRATSRGYATSLVPRQLHQSGSAKRFHPTVQRTHRIQFQSPPEKSFVSVSDRIFHRSPLLLS